MSRHDRTLEAIFGEPTPANIAWRDIESLLQSLGASVSESAGSRVRVSLNDVVAVFHRPHPRKEASRPLVRAVRTFLERAGVRAEPGEDAETGEDPE